MGFTNEGPYASFYDNGFVPVKFVNSNNPATYNNNIRCDKNSIFMMEVCQFSDSATSPFYRKQAVILANNNTGSIYALGGNVPIGCHTNSTTSDKVVLGFTCAGYDYDTYMRVTPIFGKIEILG